MDELAIAAIADADRSPYAAVRTDAHAELGDLGRLSELGVLRENHAGIHDRDDGNRSDHGKEYRDRDDAAREDDRPEYRNADFGRPGRAMCCPKSIR